MADRETVIRGLEICANGVSSCQKCPFKDKCKGTSNAAMAAAIELLKAQEPVWISVKDRLPDVRGNFLVVAIEAGKYIHITLSEFSKYFIMTGRRSYWKVTHWMPLPEPPKEDE